MALETIQKITLDFTVPRIKNIRCVEDDKNSRTIKINITNNGEIYHLDSGSMDVKYKIHKPDHTFIYNTVPIDSDGGVTIELPDQAMSVPGISKSELQVSESKNGKIISTMPFNIIVEKSVLSNQDIISKSESNVFDNIIGHITDHNNPHKVTKEQLDIHIATETDPGLVKSGTDIDVDVFGNVSVKDYSHLHYVSNIKDLSATPRELNYTVGVTSGIQGQIDSKADIDSPSLTGTPKAPTAPPGTNDTQIATTEFVQEVKSGLDTDISGKVDKVDGKGLSTNDYTDTDKNKLNGIEAGAEVNVKSDWNETNPVSDSYIENKPIIPSNPEDVGAAPSLHTHPDATLTKSGFMSASNKEKLDGIEDGANKYIHPSTHPASMILQDSTHRFVTDTEKTAWGKSYEQATKYTDGKIADLIGTADEAMDTLGELSDAIKKNGDTVKAINEAIGKKANQSELDSHVNNNTIHVTNTDKENWNKDIGDREVTFSPASTRTNISTGDKLKTILGKIAKWFSDLKTVAFTGSYNDLKDQPTIPPAYTHPNYTSKSSGLYKFAVDGTGHVNATSVVTKSDITALGIPGTDTDTTYDEATSSKSGLMSATDKAKLDGISSGANKYSHPTYTAKSSGLYKIVVDGSGHVSSTSNVTKSDITALGISGTDTTYSTGTNTTSGITKLYNSTGANTDGAMTQKAITDELSNKSPNTHKHSYNDLTDKPSPYTHPTTSGNKHIPSGGSSGQILRWSSDGTAVWGADNNTTYSNMKGATTSVNGASGLVPAPTAGTATRYLRSDGTWQVPPDNNTTYGIATASSAGLMSATDKAKLDGIASGATSGSYTHPTYTSRSSGLYKITVDGTGHVSAASKVTKKDITDLGISDSSHSHSDYLPLAGGTMTGSIETKNVGTAIIQNQANTSHSTAIVAWKDGLSNNSILSGISRYNMGGDGTGSITLLPYATDSMPYSGNVGLYIGKNILKLDGKNIPTQDYLNAHYTADYICTKFIGIKGVGWKKIAECTSGDIGDNSCIISIQRYFKTANNEYHRLHFLNTYNSYEFKPIVDKSNTQIITKARFVKGAEDKCYIEIFNTSSDENGAIVSIEGMPARGITWKILSGVEDTEVPTIGTVATTYDIPANFNSTMLAMKDGSNVSGVWKNLSAGTVYGEYTQSGGSQPPSYVPNNRVKFNMMRQFKGLTDISEAYMDCMLMDCYEGGDVPYVTGFAMAKGGRIPRAFIALGSKGNSTSWGSQAELITTANYQDYLTGGGSSGNNLIGETSNIVTLLGANVASTSSDNNKECVLIGKNIQSNSSKAILIGFNINTNDSTGEPIIVGISTVAQNGGVAIGHSSNAWGKSIAIGHDSFALANNADYGSIGIGYKASAEQNYSISIGTNSISTGTAGISIGNTSSSSSKCISIGEGTISKSYGIAIGQNSAATNIMGVSIGAKAIVSGGRSIAIGEMSSVNGSYALAIGSHANCSEDSGIAIGQNSNAAENYSIAIGAETSAVGDYSIVIGKSAYANASFSIGIGSGANAYSPYSTAIGVNASVSSPNTLQLGCPTSLSSLQCKVSLTITSDERDKIDIEPINKSAVEFLNHIEAFTYQSNQRILYIDEEENLSEKDKENKAKYGICAYDKAEHSKGTKKGSRRRAGVSAQEVQKALEEVYGTSSYANLVNDNLFDYDKDDIPEDVESQLSVNYEGFVPFLIKAVQELSEEIADLKSEISLIKGNSI